MTSFQQKVYDVVRKIPHGRVSTYKDIARAIGKTDSARAVGNALNKNRDLLIPCHRVVCSDGKLGGYNRGKTKKSKLLQEEGVIIFGDFINLKKYV